MLGPTCARICGARKVTVSTTNHRRNHKNTRVPSCCVRPARTGNLLGIRPSIASHWIEMPRQCPEPFRRALSGAGAHRKHGQQNNSYQKSRAEGPAAPSPLLPAFGGLWRGGLRLHILSQSSVRNHPRSPLHCCPASCGEFRTYCPCCMVLRARRPRRRRQPRDFDDKRLHSWPRLASAAHQLAQIPASGSRS